MRNICAIALFCVLVFAGLRHADAGKKVKVITTAAPTKKLCHRHGDLDHIFTRTFSVMSMQKYCEMLDSASLTMRITNSQWPSISNREGSCYDDTNWRFKPSDFAFVLKAVFRHHIDLNKDQLMSSTELRRFLLPTLRYHLLPGLLDAEYQHLLTKYFDSRRHFNEDTFVGIMLRMLREEWRLVVQRTIVDLDGDNCVTRMEYARAICRKKINDIDFYFRIADLDNNRAVTSPEFEYFKSITPVEPGEERGAKKFFELFDGVAKIVDGYTEDYYQYTSFAHDDMITFNEINLYICVHII